MEVEHEQHLLKEQRRAFIFELTQKRDEAEEMRARYQGDKEHFEYMYRGQRDAFDMMIVSLLWANDEIVFCRCRDCQGCKNLAAPLERSPKGMCDGCCQLSGVHNHPPKQLGMVEGKFDSSTPNVQSVPRAPEPKGSFANASDDQILSAYARAHE